MNEYVKKEHVSEVIREFFKDMVDKKHHKTVKKQMKYINMLLKFNVELQARIDNLNKNNGWILTRDELPEVSIVEHHREVLVMIDGAKTATTLFYSYDGTWVDGDNEDVYNVVAWQPLPEAPTEF